MTIDPYQVLGIRRNVSKKTIKAAYRRKAMESHPDRGGDEETFQEVKLAYEILSDDMRRERYDRTGSYEEEKPDNSHTAVLGILAPVLDHTIAEAVTAGRHPEALDLVKRMRETIEAARRQPVGTITRLKENITTLTKLLGRFSTEGEENLLEGCIQTQIAQAEASIHAIEAELVKVDAALAYLAKYKFRADKPAGKDGEDQVDLVRQLMGMMNSKTTFYSSS